MPHEHMDPDRRRALEKLREQRKLEHVADIKQGNVQELLDACKKEGIRAETFTDENAIDDAFDWLSERFSLPLAFANLPTSRSIDDAESLAKAVGELTAQEKISKDAVVRLCFNYGHYPLVTLPFSAFAKPDITAILHPLGYQDWWGFDPKDSWCLEMYHEGILTFARASQKGDS